MLRHTLNASPKTAVANMKRQPRILRRTDMLVIGAATAAA